MEGFSRLLRAPDTDAGLRAHLERVMDTFLDRYASNESTSPTSPSTRCAAEYPYGAANGSRSCAWGVLHNQSYHWDPQLFGTVGDHFGLFPVANLNRFLRPSGDVGDRGGRTEDFLVAARVAVEYNMQYPYRIADGTFSRTGGFETTPSSPQHLASQEGITHESAPFLWADDQFMGLTLLSRLARLNRSVIPASQQEYLTPALQQVGA